MFKQALSDFAAWLKDLLLWVPLKLWELLLDGLASVIEAIPVPDFVNSAQGYFNGISPQILWVLNLFAVPEGMTMVMAALVLRFVVRRLPVVG